MCKRWWQSFGILRFSEKSFNAGIIQVTVGV